MANQVDPDFLRQEYFHLQKTVEDFDQRALTIKAWSVTVSMTGVGAAITREAPSLFLLAAASALLFWITEALWKSFQFAYYHRIKTIEAYMRGEGPADFSAPDICRAWGVGWHGYSSVRTLIWLPHVFLPHALVVLVGLIGWVADWYSRTNLG